MMRTEANPRPLKEKAQSRTAAGCSEGGVQRIKRGFGVMRKRGKGAFSVMRNPKP